MAQLIDPKDIAVANLTPPAPAAPTEPVDFSDLNDPPGEFDQLPPAPTVPPATPAATQIAAPAAPATPLSHPPAIVQAARDLGIRDSVINALSTDDLIAHAFDLQRRFDARDTNDARRVQQVAVQEPVLPTAQRKKSAQEILDRVKNELGADPELVELLSDNAKEIAELKKSEQARQQRDQGDDARRQSNGEEVVDAAIEHLGPRFAKLLGTGPISGLAEGPQRSKRLVIFRNAGIDFQNDSERTIERKIAKAAIEVYGDVLPADEAATAAATNAYEEKAKANGHKTKEEWDAGALAKPTGTKPAKTKGQRAAAEAIRDQMQEWGIHSGSPADEFDGIPN